MSHRPGVTPGLLLLQGIAPLHLDRWLGQPFDIANHEAPLVGFLDLEGLTNIEVLARLIGINGGFKAQEWGTIAPGSYPYGYHGLGTFDEVILLIALVNYGAGLCHGAEEDRARFHDLVMAQVCFDNPHLDIYPPQ